MASLARRTGLSALLAVVAFCGYGVVRGRKKPKFRERPTLKGAH